MRLTHFRGCACLHYLLASVLVVRVPDRNTNIVPRTTENAQEIAFVSSIMPGTYHEQHTKLPYLY